MTLRAFEVSCAFFGSLLHWKSQVGHAKQLKGLFPRGLKVEIAMLKVKVLIEQPTQSTSVTKLLVRILPSVL